MDVYLHECPVTGSDPCDQRYVGRVPIPCVQNAAVTPDLQQGRVTYDVRLCNAPPVTGEQCAPTPGVPSVNTASASVTVSTVECGVQQTRTVCAPLATAGTDPFTLTVQDRCGGPATTFGPYSGDWVTVRTITGNNRLGVEVRNYRNCAYGTPTLNEIVNGYPPCSSYSYDRDCYWIDTNALDGRFDYSTGSCSSYSYQYECLYGASATPNVAAGSVTYTVTYCGQPWESDTICPPVPTTPTVNTASASVTYGYSECGATTTSTTCAPLATAGTDPFTLTVQDRCGGAATTFGPYSGDYVTLRPITGNNRLGFEVRTYRNCAYGMPTANELVNGYPPCSSYSYDRDCYWVDTNVQDGRFDYSTGSCSSYSYQYECIYGASASPNVGAGSVTYTVTYCGQPWESDTVCVPVAGAQPNTATGSVAYAVSMCGVPVTSGTTPTILPPPRTPGVVVGSGDGHTLYVDVYTDCQYEVGGNPLKPSCAGEPIRIPVL